VKARIWLVTIVMLGLFAVGFFFLRGPKPIIEIKGEKLADIGPFPLLNTYVTALTVMVVILVLAYLGTRRLQLVPSGLQNAVEGVAEALYNLCVQTAGEKNGRRFFPVAATIFTFIWIANWMALLPIFNAFGSIEEVDAHHFHEEAHVFDKVGGIGVIMPFSMLGGSSPLVEFHVDESVVNQIDDEITKAKADGAPAEELEQLKKSKEDAEVHARQDAILDELKDKKYVPQDTPDYDTAVKRLDDDGKQIGIMLPFFRSMNTDLNSPLSFAIISVIFIEFWGITGLGLFKYGGKFINFSSPIAFFVGFLEMITEFARIISFTFRLFGNMLAGEILLLVMTFLIPFIIALPFYALEAFVGMIQAFVFFMLTIAFGALAVAEHGEHDGEADSEHGLVSAEYGADALPEAH
jgi:F-type H+-transporting ATPase subunit a